MISRDFCRSAVLSVKFDGRVYYACDAKHGKYGKQIKQFHNLGLSVMVPHRQHLNLNFSFLHTVNYPMLSVYTP